MFTLYPDNTEFIYAILKNRKRFEALRSFTLESGQEEIERRNRRRKEAAASGASSDNPLEPASTRSSVDSLRSPTAPSSHMMPTLGDVPEEDGTFAIGDDDSDDDDSEERPTPSVSSPGENNHSRASSVTGGGHGQAAGAEDDVPRQLRGMSEKARGKMPAGARNFSRQNSTTSLGGGSVSGGGSPTRAGRGSISGSVSGAFEPTAEWIDSWLPELPLHTVLTVIQQLTALLLQKQQQPGSIDSATIVDKIKGIQLVGVDPSPVRVHSFEWSPLALGWYESLLWGFIFASEIQIAKGTLGVWNATHIKLFRVQETAPQGPSLTSPRGAVDAVGSNIVSRIGAINLRGTGSASAHTPPHGSD